MSPSAPASSLFHTFFPLPHPCCPLGHILSVPSCPGGLMDRSVAGRGSEVPSHVRHYVLFMPRRTPTQVSRAPDCHREVLKPTPGILFANTPLPLVLPKSPFLHTSPILLIYFKSSCWDKDFPNSYGYLVFAGME